MAVIRFPYQLPFDGFEERMVHDLHEAGVLLAAQSLQGILVEEAFQNGRGLDAQRPRDTDGFLENHF